MGFGFVLLNVLSLAFLAVIIVMAFVRREVRSAGELGLCCLASFFWSLSSVAEILSPSFEWKLFWRNAAQLGTFCLPPAVLAFSTAYINLDRRRRRTASLILFVAAIIPVALIWTDGAHHLMRESIGLHANTRGFETLVVKQTLLGKIFLALNDVYIFVGLGLLAVYAFGQSASPRRAALGALAGMLLPWLFAILKASLGQASFAGVPTSSTFALGGGAVLFGVLRVGLLGLGSIGRDRAFEVLDEGILVIDADRRLVDVNPAARRMLSRWLGAPEDADLGLLGSRLREAPGVAQSEAFLSGQEVQLALPRRGRESASYLSLRLYPLASGGREAGHTLVIRDVTAETNRLSELMSKAERDSLTGAYNKAAFAQIVCEMLGKADSRGCLAIFDVDRFKEVNDVHGHLAGDAVLKGICGLCRESLREGDILGRVGGDEFALYLADASECDALALAERIRSRIAQAEFGTVASAASEASASAGEALRASISVGAAQASSEGESFEDLFARADAALYRAKAAGRDRVVVV